MDEFHQNIKEINAFLKQTSPFLAYDSKKSINSDGLTHIATLRIPPDGFSGTIIVYTNNGIDDPTIEPLVRQRLLDMKKNHAEGCLTISKSYRHHNIYLALAKKCSDEDVDRICSSIDQMTNGFFVKSTNDDLIHKSRIVTWHMSYTSGDSLKMLALINPILKGTDAVKILTDTFNKDIKLINVLCDFAEKMSYNEILSVYMTVPLLNNYYVRFVLTKMKKE